MVSAKTDIGNQHFLIDEVVKTRKKIMCFQCLSAALDFEAEPSPGRFHSFFGVRIQKQISAEVRTNHEKYKIKKQNPKAQSKNRKTPQNKTKSENFWVSLILCNMQNTKKETQHFTAKIQQPKNAFALF